MEHDIGQWKGLGFEIRLNYVQISTLLPLINYITSLDSSFINYKWELANFGDWKYKYIIHFDIIGAKH